MVAAVRRADCGYPVLYGKNRNSPQLANGDGNCNYLHFTVRYVLLPTLTTLQQRALYSYEQQQQRGNDTDVRLHRYTVSESLLYVTISSSIICSVCVLGSKPTSFTYMCCTAVFCERVSSVWCAHVWTVGKHRLEGEED